MKTLLVLAACVGVTAAHASAFHVTWNLGGLKAFNNTHYLDFQLTDGSGSGDGNAKVHLFNIQLSGGTWGSALPDLGGVTYGPGNSVDLTDSGIGLADHAPGFLVTDDNAVLTFDFGVSSTSTDPGTPDYFNVQLLDWDANAIATHGPNGVEFISYLFTGDADQQPDSSIVDTDVSPLYDHLAGPEITPVPEPTTLATFGLLAFGALRRRRR